MKISRKLLNTIIGITAGVAIVSTATTIMATSYSDYINYYNRVLEEKEHQKYLNSLPLELLGIDASLKSGVNYYDNGRANPKTDDFHVVAHFTEKGKEFDSILQAKDYAIEVPEDFKDNGGTVKVSYTYTYEEEKKENASSSSSEEAPSEPKTVTKTADVDISLTAIKLDHLVLIENPYRVYYREGMAFSKEGMKAKVVYNDGSEKTLDASSIAIEGNDSLTVGMESAKVSYQEGDDKITLEVPITVVSDDEYSDGNIVAIDAEGTPILKEGDPLSSANVAVRASYSNGNRLILGPNSYTKTSNVSKASFMKNCILTIKTNGANPVETRIAVKVNNGYSADDIKTGGTSSKVHSFINGSKEETESVVVTGAASFAYEIDVPYVAKTNFTVRLANIGNEMVSLGKSLSLKVNNIDIPLNQTQMIPSGEGQYCLNDIALPDLVLKAGKNKVVLSLKNNGDTLAISRFDMYTMYQGEVYSSLDEYMGKVAKEGGTFDADLSQVVDWGNEVASYCHGLATDGTYIYGTFTNYSTSARKMKVAKYSPDGTLLATSAWTNANYLETCAGVTYYDGKLVLFHSGGGQSYLETKDLKDGASFIECKEGEEIFSFEGLDGKTIRDVYYNANMERFAVLVDNSITLFTKDMQKICSFSPKIVGDYGNAVRMSGAGRYILVNYSKNGVNQPVIAVYDYDGNRIGQFQIPNSLSDMGGETALPKPNCMNTQGFTYLDGTFYFSLIRFTQGKVKDGTSIMTAKLKMIKDELESDFSFGEYISACGDDYDVETEAKPVIGQKGNIQKGGYQMGLAADGECIYAAKNTYGNAKTALYKIDPATWEVKEQTAEFSTMLPSDGPTDDNSQLMVKDGKLYTFIYPDSDKCRALSIPLTEFASGTPKEEKLPFEGKTEARVRSCYYSEITEQYAVVDDNKKLYYFDENGDQVGETKNLVGSAGMNVRSITGDDKYVYISYSTNNQASLPIETYTLTGDYVGLTPIPGISLGELNGQKQGFNIQSTVCYKGDFYAGVCTWQGDFGLNIWKASVDPDVFTMPRLSRIEASSDTNRFLDGEEIAKHLTVTAYYEDGSKAKVEDFTVSPSLATSGLTSFTVSYTEGKVTKTCEISGFSVVAPSSGSLGDYFLTNGEEGMKNLAFSDVSIDNEVKQYVMGGAYYNGYIYLASAQSISNNTKTYTIVSKIDPKTYDVISSKKIDHADFGGDGAKLFIKGTKLYFITSARLTNSAPYELWSIDLDDKVNGFDSETGAFAKVDDFPISGASSIQYSATNDKYALLQDNNLLVADKDGKNLASVSCSLSGYTPSSVFVDDNYIYVSYKTDNQKAAPIAIFDWSGDKIGTAQIGVPNGLSKYNVQAIFSNGKDIYAAICNWGGTSTKLWKLTLV